MIVIAAITMAHPLRRSSFILSTRLYTLRIVKPIDLDAKNDDSESSDNVSSPR